MAHAAVDEARFQHDATTGSEHLLLEQARTNLLFDTDTPDTPDTLDPARNHQSS